MTLPQKTLLGLLLSASLLAIWSAASAGWHDFQLMKPRAVVDSWRNGTPPGMKLWGITLEQLKRAQARKPDDPQVAESLGYLFAYQAMRSREIPELEQALLVEAIGYFRDAIRCRPMSPYPWGNLALALHKKNEAPEEMWAAFDHAMRYGQREFGVQKQLAEIAFAHWGKAGYIRQGQMKEIVTSVQGYSYRMALLEIAEHNNVRGLLDDPLVGGDE
ncbi:MAG: hypothetical protein WAV95_08140 [Azonexus sp.]